MGRADALLIAGKSELALVDSCNVLRLVPNFFPALMLRCLIHQSAGNHPAALADAEAAIAAGCPLAAGLYLRGQSRIHLAQPQEALPDVLQAVQLDPASVDYRYSLAVTWSLLQNLNAAIAELDLVLTIDSHLTAARLLRGLLHINQNALDKAADDLDHVLQQPGFFGLAFFGRALVHRLRGEYELALQLLNQALLMDPTDADCLRERAILAAIRSEMTAAEQDINESLLWKPDDLRALLIRASLRLAGGRIDAAARDLQQIRRGSPDPKIAENVEIGLEIIERLRRERGNQSESS
jgi:tetratricopeptide (TPR) repeat protein